MKQVSCQKTQQRRTKIKKVEKINKINKNKEICVYKASANKKRRRIFNPVLTLHKMQLHIQRIQLNFQISKEKILKLALSLKNLGYSDAYLANMVRALTRIAKEINLDNTCSFCEFVAKGKWRQSYKANLCDYYAHYCKFYKIIFVKPKYHRDHNLPRVPTEERINLIIGHASKKYGIIYKIAMECGLRPVEIGNLTLNDIDLEKGLIS